MRNLVLLCTPLLLCLPLLGGCFKADVSVPERINIGGDDVYNAPPPAQIPPAQPNNVSDLSRENQQLRQRVDYLENQNRKLAKKYDDQANDIDDIRADMDKIAAERDRYKRALGQ